MSKGRQIIALTGLSGSGKTYLIERLKNQLDFVHLSASQLLKDRAEKSGSPIDSESLRLGDINDNQRELIAAFIESANSIENDIVFDCHTLIDTPAGLQRIPASVFAAMGITDILFLSVFSNVLSERRSRDTGRSRPQRSSAELNDHQVIALNAAKDIAAAIGASFLDIGEAPEKHLSTLLRLKTGGRDEFA